MDFIAKTLYLILLEIVSMLSREASAEKQNKEQVSTNQFFMSLNVANPMAGSKKIGEGGIYINK